MDSDSEPYFNNPFFKITPEESAQIFRMVRNLFLAFALLSIFLIPVIKNGYFKEQAQLKRARALIEGRGYAYCAIWGDGSDPFMLTAQNSPLLPRWSGERQLDGSYLMMFTYRRSGKAYRHQWAVDLSHQRVQVVSDDTRVPVNYKDDERKCSEY